MYDKGKGVIQSSGEAFKWYSKAAEHNESDAQYNIGLMYLKGEGTEKNVQLAKQWLQLASNQGDLDAKELLKTF